MERIQNRRDLTPRRRLAAALPLATPFSVYVDPASACNFRCEFCCQAIEPATLRRIGFRKEIMKMDLFARVVESIEEFPDRLKVLSLFLKGEPFLNRRLPDMIALAKARDITERVFVTTNGSLFEAGLSRRLVKAGVDEILVSIEGLDAAEYQAIAGVSVDYGEMLAGIRDFYEHRGDCGFYIKIALHAREEERERRFHELFDPLCDLAYVERILPVFERVDYDRTPLDRSGLQKFGRPIKVCTRPFFNLCVHAGGEIGPCIADYVPEIRLGNARHDSLRDVWNGEALRELRRLHLRGERFAHHKCGPCGSPDWDSQATDLLDDEAERLLGLFAG